VVIHLPGSQRFVVDVQLARLARQLRVLGLDTVWRGDLTDDEIVRLSHEEQRLALTCDRGLFARLPEDRRTLVEGNLAGSKLDEFLIHLLKTLGLQDWVAQGRGFLNRCLECNSPLLRAEPHQVHAYVSGEILTQYDEFFLCTRCERVYWKGSHYDRMRAWIEELSRKLQLPS
jgi:uncharacterized protein with PIN domain